MTITELCKKAHENAVNKGFYDDGEKNIGELLMLVVSELGEALEADRKNNYCTDDVIVSHSNNYFEVNIKDSFQDELADAVIRIADMAAYMAIDLEAHIIAKMRYNETRPAKHGKKY